MHLSLAKNLRSCIRQSLGRRHIMVIVGMKDMISKASIVYQVIDYDIYVTEKQLGYICHRDKLVIRYRAQHKYI